MQEIQAVPGVSSAALTSYIPLANSSWTLGIHVPNAQGEEVGDSKFTYVSPGYFATMDVPFVSGRDFNSFDRADTARVAIVNEAFVRRYIRAASPIGARVRTVAEPGNPSTVYDVIGVVKDTKYGNLREGTPAMTFVPSTQNPDRRPNAVMAIHSSIAPDALVSDLRRRIKESHPDMLVRFRVFERQIQDGLSRERLMAWLAGFFGVRGGSPRGDRPLRAAVVHRAAPQPRNRHPCRVGRHQIVGRASRAAPDGPARRSPACRWDFPSVS